MSDDPAKEKYLRRCRKSFEEMKAGWTKGHCKWWNHSWADVGTDGRGWTETRCKTCGKFYGYRKPGMAGIVQPEHQDD